MNGRQPVSKSLVNCSIEVFRQLVFRPRWTWDEGHGIVEEDTWDVVVVMQQRKAWGGKPKSYQWGGLLYHGLSILLRPRRVTLP